MYTAFSQYHHRYHYVLSEKKEKGNYFFPKAYVGHKCRSVSFTLCISVLSVISVLIGYIFNVLSLLSKAIQYCRKPHLNTNAMKYTCVTSLGGVLL